MKNTINKHICLLLCITINILSYSPIIAQTIYDDKIIMQKGEDIIDDFFNPNHSSYFGKKIVYFYSDDYMKIINNEIIKVSKEKNMSTEDATKYVMTPSFIKVVFGDLENNLSSLLKNSNCNLKQEFDSKDIKVDDPSYAGAVLASIKYGVVPSAVLYAVIVGYLSYTSLTIGVAAAWGLWWGTVTMAGLTWSGIIAGLISGPWGWAALGTVTVASIVGVKWYLNKKQQAVADAIDNSTKLIEAHRGELVTAWRLKFGVR